MAGSDLIFIVGRQRSGTTVFRDLMQRGGALDCDEIFHGNLEHKYRFYRFLGEKVSQRPELVHPEFHQSVWNDYLRWMRQEADGRKLAMDVKYFALNLIPTREDVDAQMPFIVSFMKHSRAHVLHIIRRNKLRIFVSEEMARATGVWSAGKKEHLVQEKPKLTVDPARAVSVIESLQHQDERVTRMLSDAPGIERIFYDEMFTPDGMFSSETVKIASKFLDDQEIDPKPGNLRMNPEGLEALVENYDELEDCVSKTPHGWMLSDPN